MADRWGEVGEDIRAGQSCLVGITRNSAPPGTPNSLSVPSHIYSSPGGQEYSRPWKYFIFLHLLCLESVVPIMLVDQAAAGAPGWPACALFICCPKEMFLAVHTEPWARDWSSGGDLDLDLEVSTSIKNAFLEGGR